MRWTICWGAAPAGAPPPRQAPYTRTAPQPLAILMRLRGARASAEGALRGAHIRVYKQAGQFERIKGRAMPWMVAIARNRVIDLQRAGRPA